MVNQGWICPKCGRVWAPSVNECLCSVPDVQPEKKGDQLPSPLDPSFIYGFPEQCVGCWQRHTFNCGTYPFCPMHMKKYTFTTSAYVKKDS